MRLRSQQRRGPLLPALTVLLAVCGSLCPATAAAAAQPGLDSSGGGAGRLPRRLQQAAAADAGGKRCPALTRDVLAKRARNNTLMLAVVRAGHGLAWGSSRPAPTSLLCRTAAVLLPLPDCSMP